MARDSKSTLLTNLDRAEAPHLANVNLGHGRVRRKAVSHTIPLAGTPAIGDRHALMRFNSGDHIVHINVSAPADAAAVITADLGLYLANGGAELDDDCFASAMVLNTTINALTNLNQKYESGITIWSNAHQPLWEAYSATGPGATLTADPFVQYDLEFTETAALTTADCNVFVEVLYVAGD